MDKYSILMNLNILLTSELFQRDWTEGNLDRIPWLVNVLGTAAGIVISAGGFGIVVTSIMKNVFSGVYLLNSKFWDNVDAVKQAAVDGVDAGFTAMGSKNAALGKISNVGSALLKLLPNVKDLTDFAGDDGKAVAVTAKGYFLRAIPKAIAAICLGMLIYYGYTAKFAEATGETVSYALDSVLDKFNAETIAQTINQNLVVLRYSTADSGDPVDKVVYEASKDSMKVILANFTDMQKQPKQETAYTVEGRIMDALHNSGLASQITDSGYKVTANAAYYTQAPQIANSFTQEASGMWVSQTESGQFVYKWYFPCSDLPLGTTLDATDKYVLLTFMATPVASTNVSTTEMVCYTGLSTTGTVVKDYYKIALPGINVGSGSGDLQGSLGRSVTTFLYDSSGEIIATLNPIIESTSNGAGTLILSFNKTDKETVQTAATTGYIRIELTGSWNVSNVSANNVATWQVKTLYAKSGMSTGYRLTSDSEYKDGDPTNGTSLSDAIK